MAGQNQHWIDGLPIPDLTGSSQNKHWVDGLPMASLEDEAISSRLTHLIVQNLRGGTTAPSNLTKVTIQILKSDAVPEARLTNLVVQQLSANITPPTRLTNLVVQYIYGVPSISGSAIVSAGSSIYTGGDLVTQFLIGLVTVRSNASVGIGGALVETTAPEGGESAFRIYIAGTNRTAFYRDASLRIDLQSNMQGSASFTLIDETGAYLPQEGMTVRIEYFDAPIPEINGGVATEEWHNVFSGKIVSAPRKKTRFLASHSELTFDVQCADWTSWLTRRRISRKYTSGKTLAYILSDIHHNYLLPEGISWVNTGTATDILGAIIWDNVTIPEALNFLATSTDKSWIIDASAALYFEVTPNPTTPPFELLEDDGQTWANLVVKPTLALYANKITVRSSAQIENPPQTSELENFTSENTPTFPYFRYFDGTEYKDYTWKGQVSRITSIKINGVEKNFYTVGETAPVPWHFVQVTPGDIDLVYNHGDHGFLSFGDVVTVAFEVSTSAVPPVTVQDDTEIAERKSIEGGTGIYEADYSVENVTDTVQLTKMAESILAKSKIKGLEVTSDVLAFGLMPGHSFSGSTFASYGVTTPVDLRVDNVSMWDIGGLTKRIHTSVAISNSGVQRDGITAIRNLIERLRGGTSAGSSSGGGGSSRDLPITIVLAGSTPSVPSLGLTVADDVTNHLALDQDFSPRSISVVAKVPPVGSPATFMLTAGGIDILTADISYPESGGLLYYNSLLITTTIPAGTIIGVNVTGIGSTDPGSDVTIVLTGRV